jgi:hypothetical protein
LDSAEEEAPFPVSFVVLPVVAQLLSFLFYALAKDEQTPQLSSVGLLGLLSPS